jgi:dihydrolipoamide dehydrogenase
MARTFDVIVIGAGPGGYVAAIRAAQLGLKAVVVEREHLGGICLNWGCIPTKALLRSSEVFHLFHRAAEFGLKIEKPDFDFEAVIKRSRGVAKQLSGGIGHLLKKNKVEVIMGEARLTAPGKVAVTTAKGGDELEAPAVILATGARARELPGLEADGDLVWTYKNALPAAADARRAARRSHGASHRVRVVLQHDGARTTWWKVADRNPCRGDSECRPFAKKQFVQEGKKKLTILEGATDKKLDRRRR